MSRTVMSKKNVGLVAMNLKILNNSLRNSLLSPPSLTQLTTILVNCHRAAYSLEPTIIETPPVHSSSVADMASDDCQTIVSLGIVLLKPVESIPILMVTSNEINLDSVLPTLLIQSIKVRDTVLVMLPVTEVTNLHDLTNTHGIRTSDSLTGMNCITMPVTSDHDLCHVVPFVRC